jgi:hypothetical protein
MRANYRIAAWLRIHPQENRNLPGRSAELLTY